MEMIRVENSSNVAAYGYDAVSKSLVIEFKAGSKYKYADVPQETVDAFAESKSKGQFVRKTVIPNHACERIVDE